MKLFKRNPLKNIQREDVVKAIMDLEKKKDELQNDVYLKEKNIQTKINQGKKSKSLSEKKVLANDVMMLQRQSQASHKRISFIEKKIYVTEQVKLAIDDLEFSNYNKKSSLNKLFKNSDQLQRFLENVVETKTQADQELLDQVEIVDGTMGAYTENEMLYSQSDEMNKILSMMESDDFDSDTSETEKDDEEKALAQEKNE